MIEQEGDDVGEAAAGGIDDRRLLGLVHDLRVGALLDQELHDRLAAHIGCGGKRRDAASPGEADIGAAIHQLAHDWQPPGLRSLVERGGAFQTARIDLRAAIEEQGDDLLLPGLRRAGERIEAAAVPRFERGAGIEERLGQRLATLFGCREQHGVDFERGRAALDLLVALLERLADLHVGMSAGDGERQRGGGRGDEGETAGATQEHR